MNKLLLPRLYTPDICGVSYSYLLGMGKRGLIFDLDGTLAGSDEDTVSGEIKSLIYRLKKKFRIVILTNAILPSRVRRAEKIAEELVVELIALRRIKQLKPNRIAFCLAIQTLRFPIGNVAMIGDQACTDILGANRLGIYSVMVDRRGPLSFWSWLRPMRRYYDRKVRQEMLEGGGTAFQGPA